MQLLKTYKCPVYNKVIKWWGTLINLTEKDRNVYISRIYAQTKEYYIALVFKYGNMNSV